MATDRLQKILARGGIASRRAAESLITEGRVRVNGRVVSELGAKADPHKDRIEIDGQRVVSEQAVYVVLHKPRGVVSTLSDPEGRPSVKELLAQVPGRAYPVGRLDFATSGVLLVTNDGDFAEGLMHPKKAVPKTYVLKVSGVMQPEDIEQWRKGIRLEDGMTLPAQASLLRHEGDKTWLELTIREGRNQQIRRMGDATRFPVMRLARVAFAGITSEGLRPGAWRYLTREELQDLKKEYGVPKRVPAQMEEVAAGRRERGSPQRKHVPRERGAERGTRGRARTERGEARGNERGEARGNVRGEARGIERGEARGKARTQGDERAQGPKREARFGERASTEQPRYGGGSPGRRPYDVREDWGGGAGRGRTGSDREEEARGPSRRSTGRGSSSGRSESRSEGAPPRADVGGRAGASRTTGTGGGTGAGGGDYRIRGRKR